MGPKAPKYSQVTLYFLYKAVSSEHSNTVFSGDLGAQAEKILFVLISSII